MTELTILMPCLNEAETLETCIRKAQDYLQRAGISGEVLISDNGSTDGSQEIARGLGARVVDAPEKGYGAALIAGIAAAEGTYVIMGDSDDSYDFSKLDAFVEKLRGGADLVMGNRFAGRIEKHAMPPLHRYLGNPVLSTVGRLFFRTPVGDFHCGLRGFSRASIDRLRLNAPGMEFASEMVIKASLAELVIDEVPITLSPDGRSRPPHLRSWRDGWLHLKLLMTFAPHWIFYYPGLILTALGGAAFLALIGGPVSIGSVTFDITTLIMASAMVLVGFQMVCFYALARLFSVRFRLLPASARFQRFSRQISVDRACLGGGLLLASGIGVAVWATLVWAATGWGDLETGLVARMAVFAVVASSLGIQAISAGFLWNLLSQKIPGMPERTDG